jgi:L-asparagine transporter-like permease
MDHGTSLDSRASLTGAKSPRRVHLRYRTQRRAAGQPLPRFRLRRSPWTDWIVVADVALVVVLLVIPADQRVARREGP